MPKYLFWSGGIIGLLVMGLLRLIGKYFGAIPLALSMAVVSLLLIFATIKIAIPAMREKKILPGKKCKSEEA